MNSFIDSTLFFVLCVIAYVIARGFDIWASSSTSWYYGLTEGKFWLSRDKDFEFDTTKNVIGSAIWLGIAFVLTIWAHGQAGFFLIPLIIASPFAAMNNLKKARYNRTQQIAFLRGIRDSGGTFMTGVTVVRNGKAFHPLFHWLYVPATDDATADVRAIAARLYDLSQKPESEWFPA